VAVQNKEVVAILRVIPRQALRRCLIQMWWVVKVQRKEYVAETTLGSWGGRIMNCQRPEQSLAVWTP